MRYISLSLSFSRLVRLLTSISVRTRIIVLALIPVLGFLANGLTYFSGEGAVGTAFETVKHSAPGSPTPAAISRARSRRCESS